MINLHIMALMVAVLCIPNTSWSQERTQSKANPPKASKALNRPLPRYVSLKAKKANVRRGPSLSHRIDWVFTQKHMPLKVIAEYKHWRRVVDQDGQGGWVHYRLLSGKRTVIITQDLETLRSAPSSNSASVALLEKNVIATLDYCERDWCSIERDNHDGWVPKPSLWGIK